MPTYQYACTACGESLEVVQSFSDDALTECPACAGRLRKVFSAVGVVFKGSGFYRNDSRSENGRDTSGSGTSPAKEPATASTASGSSGTANGSAGSTSTPSSPSSSSSGSAPAKTPSAA